MRPRLKVGSLWREELFCGHEVLVLRIEETHIEGVEAFGGKQVYVWLTWAEFEDKYSYQVDEDWLTHQRSKQ